MLSVFIIPLIITVSDAQFLKKRLDKCKKDQQEYKNKVSVLEQEKTYWEASKQVYEEKNRDLLDANQDSLISRGKSEKGCEREQSIVPKLSRSQAGEGISQDTNARLNSVIDALREQKATLDEAIRIGTYNLPFMYDERVLNFLIIRREEWIRRFYDTGKIRKSACY